MKTSSGLDRIGSDTTFTPDSHDLLLLYVLLEQDSNDALEHWREWSSTSDIDDHSSSVYGLFPAVYRRLEDLGEAHRWVPRLKGVYRRTWTRNQLAQAGLNRAANSLCKTGIGVLASADAQIRALSVDEILTLDEPRLTVHENALIPAMRTLLDEGWRIAPGSLEERRIRDRLGRVRWGLVSPAGEQISITTRFHDDLWDPRGSDSVWDRSVPVTETAARRAASSDLLLAAIVSRLHQPKDLQWVLRARAVVRGFPDEVNLPGLDYWTPQQRGEIVDRLDFLAELEPRLAEIAHTQRSAMPHVGRQQPRAVRQAKTAAQLVKRWGGPRASLEYLRFVREIG